ncbi:Y-family DNA polymerase [Shewanella sp. SM96]|uniref:Y-family DNA polymerase n=1 Tax=Shewanella sp. SM96 TaxID=2912813 RepID=UPI0021DAF8F2|nr:Y-family DNA polymerase [Shewanella sp. SM96]MCU8005267.1 Y-family DNA polymerase [Shewanella sp. SM96]
MYGLIDANSFYVSCEMVFRPDLRGLPAIVLSNNDGCCVAINRAAKSVGVKKFAPYFEQQHLCRRHNVQVFSSNYALYADLSAKMMQVIGRFAPEQYVYSIDESFVSFQHCAAIPDLNAHCTLLRRAVWRECRLPVCVGVGETLTLAKLANHAAKQLAQYKGVCVIDNDAQRIEILKSMPVDEVWGIGRKLTVKLGLLGVHTAYDLAQLAPKVARQHFSIDVERTVRELNGQICKTWDVTKADKQQIFSTRSLGERICTREHLHQALAKHAAIAGAKVREQGSLCKTMVVFDANSTHDPQPMYFKRLVQFTCATDDSRELCAAVSRELSNLYRPGVRYYRIGVGLIDLCPKTSVQYDLFNAPKSDPNLMKIFDSLNNRYGRDVLYIAAQGSDQHWTMRREFLSPQYTTRWSDIPTVKA